MRARRVLTPIPIGLALAALMITAPGDAIARPTTAVPTSGAPWGTAHQIRGTGSLRIAGLVSGTQISCGRPGNCVLTGSERNRTRRYEPFIASEVAGRWHEATTLPGMAALDHGKTARPSAISCPSPGNCAVVGSYFNAAGLLLPFVAIQVHGTWRNATELPGMAAFNAGRSAQLVSVSCPAAGDCLAGGSYRDATGRNTQAFVASQTKGTWSAPIEVPGTAQLNTYGGGSVTSVFCVAPGACAATGRYTRSAGADRAFVANQVGGVWGTAIEVPGLSALAQGGYGDVGNVSCWSAGGCAVGGTFNGSHGQGAFVADEVRGTWLTVQKVRGLRRVDFMGITLMSCASGGACTAGGLFHVRNLPGHYEPFVVSGTKDTWGQAMPIPGIATLDKGLNAEVDALSCPSPGNCAAGGGYSDARGQDAFVVLRVHRLWHRAMAAPGTKALNLGGFADITSMTCPPTGPCTASGFFTGQQFFDVRAFVLSQR